LLRVGGSFSQSAAFGAAFEGPSGVQENMESVFVSPNLAASVRRSNIGGDIELGLELSD
jgi:hypothetical protein